MMVKFPMPNDRLDGGIVIASQYAGGFDARPEYAEAILLLPEPPYYRYVEQDLDTGAIQLRIRHDNLADAMLTCQ